MNCRICNTIIDVNQALKIPEKMFGTGEIFNYVICSHCLCLQIVDIPDNIGNYYPDNYYSFKSAGKISFINRLKQFVFNFLSRIKKDFYKKTKFNDYAIYYNDRNKEIIDIGCGEGNRLIELRKWGFKKLTGTDPFIKEKVIKRRLKIYKLETENIKGSYDIVMSHHSLEHMPDPAVLFRKVKKILKPDGKFILRIPIYPNYIWEKYSEHWIQLDTPRHCYTFSMKTINYLCSKYSFVIAEKRFDGAPWAIASTEFCLNGNNHHEFCKHVKITDKQIKICKEANQNQFGDQVCLIIKHKNE